jgi:hypothetical protein
LVDDTAFEQALQSVAEDVRGDAFGGAGKVFEAIATEDEIADDEEGPLVAEQVERASQGAGRAT